MTLTWPFWPLVVSAASWQANRRVWGTKWYLCCRITLNNDDKAVCMWHEPTDRQSQTDKEADRGRERELEMRMYRVRCGWSEHNRHHSESIDRSIERVLCTRIMACDSSLHSMCDVDRLMRPRSVMSLSFMYRKINGRRTTYAHRNAQLSSNHMQFCSYVIFARNWRTLGTDEGKTTYRSSD